MTTALKISISLIVALLFGVSILKAAEVEQAPVNCIITVKSTKKMGEILRRVFLAHAESDAECKKMARAHRTNFAPHVFKKVESSAKWTK
jgi:hypothetical protein